MLAAGVEKSQILPLAMQSHVSLLGWAGGVGREGRVGTHSLGYCLGGHLPLVGQLVLQAFHLLLPLQDVPLVHGGSWGLCRAADKDIGAMSQGCVLPRLPPAPPSSAPP